MNRGGAFERLAAALRVDMRLQARSGLYAIGGSVAVLLGLAGRTVLPPEAVAEVLPAFYLVALGGTTYVYVASMLLLEKSERTLDALRVSPMTVREYLVSKVVTLSGFAAVEAAVLYAIASRAAPASVAPLAAGVLVLGVSMTLLGIGQAASYDSVTSFLLPGALIVSLVLQTPFLFVVGVGPDALWYLVPTQAPLLLMLGAFTPLRAWQWSYALGVSVLGVLAAYAFARRRLRRHVELPEP